MNIFNLFKKPIPYISGVLSDTRPPEEKQKDYKAEEIIPTAPILQWDTWENWKQKSENIQMLNDISVINQDGVSSCASCAGALALAIHNYQEDKKFIPISAKAIYARRRNKPDRGMYLDDLGNICITNGSVPETLYPSPHDTEANMSNLDNWISLYDGIGKILKAKHYFWIPCNIDAVAQILAQNKPVILTIVFGDGEFGELAPVVKPVAPKYGHAITGLPNAYFTYQGKKAILIQNSWGTSIGFNGRQILTEDWFTHNRIIMAIYFEDQYNMEPFQLPDNKPHYTFNNDLSYGMQNEEVKKLQECLRYDGEFEYPTCTGNFFGYTLKAVKNFQEKYKNDILIPAGLNESTGYVGAYTRAKLNALFS